MDIIVIGSPMVGRSVAIQSVLDNTPEARIIVIDDEPLINSSDQSTSPSMNRLTSYSHFANYICEEALKHAIELTLNQMKLTLETLINT